MKYYTIYVNTQGYFDLTWKDKTDELLSWKFKNLNRKGMAKLLQDITWEAQHGVLEYIRRCEANKDHSWNNPIDIFKKELKEAQEFILGELGTEIYIDQYGWNWSYPNEPKFVHVEEHTVPESWDDGELEC